jgi:ribosomal protein S12 methylthiotransferase
LSQFVKAARFDRLGVFSYSDEETSQSYHLDAKVENSTIYRRKRKLMALQRRISLARNRQLIGREFPVLIEGPSKETELLWEARMATQAPEIDGVCLVNDFGPGAARPGEMRRFRVTEAHDYDLVGELVDSPEQLCISAP